MQSIGLILCIHCTAPPGPVGSALHRAFERAYLPLIEVLWDMPEVRVSMHWSGALLEWLDAYAREHLRQLETMVAQGRIEILGGLFGGGLLPALPERDVIGQLQRMFAWWKQHGDPWIRGAWLPHCAWDPAAARILGQMGLRYTVLEELQLGYGVSTDGYLLTEREGTTLGLFPADERLGRMVPDTAPTRILAEIDRRAAAGARCLTMAVAGERFGAALDASATRCFGGRGWVRRFLQTLVDNNHWLKMTDFGTALDRLHPSARCYAPASVSLPVALSALGGENGARYGEILNLLRSGDASLQRVAPFLQGACWDQLLARNPELNRLHKKMLRTSVEVFRLRNTIRDRARRGMDVTTLEHALADASAALHRAQHGSAYVLGTEVGAQDGGVRHEAWANLLRSEFAVANALGDSELCRILQQDCDCDGRQEVVVRTPNLSAVLAPGQGGSLVELDVWSLPGNVINVWGRREEGFHHGLRRQEDLPLLGEDTEEAETTDVDIVPPDPPIVPRLPLAELGLEQKLFVDPYLRACFQDRFLDPHCTLDSFYQGKPGEDGDFLMGDYQVERLDQSDEVGPTVVLARDGNLNEGAAVRLARIEKSYHFPRQRAEVQVRYRLSNRFHDPIHGRFGIELNLNLDSSDGNAVSLQILRDPVDAGSAPWTEGVPVEEIGERVGVREVVLEDQVRGMRLVVSAKAGPGSPEGAATHLWHHPIQIVSRTPRGIGLLHQGSCLLFWWPVELWALERRDFELTLVVEG